MTDSDDLPVRIYMASIASMMRLFKAPHNAGNWHFLLLSHIEESFPLTKLVDSIRSSLAKINSLRIKNLIIIHDPDSLTFANLLTILGDCHEFPDTIGD